MPRCQFEQERMQRRPLLGVERREKLILHTLVERTEPSQRALAVCGEPDDVPAPVVRISLPFDEFLDRFPPLLDRHLLDRHYSPALLASAAARESWVTPDLRPLPGRG